MQNCHWTVDRIIIIFDVKFDISLPQNDIKKMNVETSHMQSSANLKYD